MEDKMVLYYSATGNTEFIAKELAKEIGPEAEKEFELYASIERLAPKVFADVKNLHAPMPANVDLYSGFVYKCLNIPNELYTPLFAIARVAGWCAHRIEEFQTSKKIIRPAYKFIANNNNLYIPLSERKD